jgi:hypothetical protein
MSDKKYTCNICNKEYKTSQSLSNHKRIYHIQSKPKVNQDLDESKPKVNLKVNDSKPEIDNTQNNKYKCGFCSNEYLFKQSKWRHEQKCNKKISIEELIKQNEIKDKEIEEIKKSFEKFKKQMLDMMNQKFKMHPKTFQKMINSNNFSNNNITINNNIKYVEIGKEDLYNVFTKKEKLMLLQKFGSPIENIVRYTHLNDKYPQFQNIIITNIRSNQAYAYNEELNKFILCDKNYLLDEMMVYRYSDLLKFFEQYSHLISTKFKDILNKAFLLKEDDTFCKNKCNEFNVIIFNECNKDNIKYKSTDGILDKNNNSLDV